MLNPFGLAARLRRSTAQIERAGRKRDRLKSLEAHGPTRWSIAYDIFWNPTVKLAVGLYAILSFLDFCSSQFWPAAVQERYPRLYQLLEMLDWKVWLIFLLILVICMMFESTYKVIKSRADAHRIHEHVWRGAMVENVAKLRVRNRIELADQWIGVINEAISTPNIRPLHGWFIRGIEAWERETFIHLERFNAVWPRHFRETPSTPKGDFIALKKYVEVRKRRLEDLMEQKAVLGDSDAVTENIVRTPKP